MMFNFVCYNEYSPHGEDNSKMYSWTCIILVLSFHLYFVNYHGYGALTFSLKNIMIIITKKNHWTVYKSENLM